MVVRGFGLLGGAESFAHHLCKQLVLRGKVEIHVFAVEWQKSDLPVFFHKIPVLFFPRFFKPLSFAYFVKKRLAKHRFDIVHSHERILTSDIFTFHGLPHRTWVREVRKKRPSLFDRSTAWIEREGLERASFVLPVSGLVQEQLRKIYDIPVSKMQVINPGVALDRFEALDREACRRLIRSRHNLPEKSLVALFVGLNFEVKGLDVILRGAAHLIGKAGEYANLRILVVGSGNIKKYRHLAHGLGIADEVVFAGVTQEVEKYFLACDFLAMPSEYDTFGLVVLEAMAAGLPVIISERVGAKDLVEHGVNGFVLKRNPAPEAFSSSLAVLFDTDTRLRMAEAARSVASGHTWEKAAERTRELYNQFLKGHRHGNRP